MLEVILFLVGLIIGIFSTIICSRMHKAGTLRMFQDSPDESPYLFLDLDMSVPEILKHNYVVMAISRK